jgi:DNA sulfur modification protein DndD
MILERLVISNFRQFHGEQEIIFSKAKRKNVTVIHAENGFGKTALLNALLWGFYGQRGLTEKLENPESIINESVAHSGGDPRDIEARVTIYFESDEQKYVLSRSLTLAQQRNDWKKARVELEFQSDGETYQVERPDWHIESLMPLGVSRFLFFDGEGIEHLAMRKNAADITNAIHQMLGLKLLQRAIDDLNHGNVRGKLAKEFRDNTDEQTVRLIDSEKRITDELGKLRQRLDANSENQKANARELDSIDAKLASNSQARELQEKREKLEEEQTITLTRLREVNQKLSSAIAEDGYTLFSGDLVRRGREITLRLRQEGKMPARVLNVFIEDLLKAAECICGCKLKEGGEARKRVEELLTVAGDQHFNNAVGALDNALGVIEGVFDKVKKLVQEGIREREEYKQQLRGIKIALDEIHQSIDDKDDEQVHELEKRREELIAEQKDLLRSEGKLEGDVTDHETELESVRRQIESSEQQAAVAARAQRRLIAVDEAIALLRTVLEHEMHDLRSVLNDEIDTHFRKIISKDYWAELSDDFILRIKKRVGIAETEVHVEVGKSGGEAQITALVFVASLVALARRRAEIPTILKELEGGEYPMVMDSPFGQLGDKYRAGVAHWIPSLAPQVVVMVTATQYKGAVEETLLEGGRVGRRYLLVYHGPEKDKNATTTISLAGQRYTQYYKGSIEYSEIKELE